MSVSGVDKDDSDKPGAGRLWILSAIVAGAALLAGFFGIDSYSAGTHAAVATSRDNAKDFETVFRDLLKQRSLIMSIAADVLLQDTTTMEAFARKDRATLVARMEPFFEQLKKHHSVEQINFWLPPATVYYRAGQPNDFGADVSKYRKTVVAANERQAARHRHRDRHRRPRRHPRHRAGHGRRQVRGLARVRQQPRRAAGACQRNGRGEMGDRHRRGRVRPRRASGRSARRRLAEG